MTNNMIIIFFIMLNDTILIEQESTFTNEQLSSLNLPMEGLWLQSIIIGLVASCVWFLIMEAFKPKIKISNTICKQLYKWEDDDDHHVVYFIKIINKSLWNIVNVSFSVTLNSAYFFGDNQQQNYNVTSLRLKRSNYQYIQGRFNKDKRLNDNCIQIGIISDLDTMWHNPDNQWVQFQVLAYHGLSGRIRAKKKKFTVKCNTILVNQEFMSGHTFKTLPTELKIS